MDKIENTSALGSGVGEDVENIINIFVQQRDPSFEKFSDVWRQLRFSQIFCGFKSFSTLMEFSEVLVNTVKEHALAESDCSLYTLGAVYLLYAVFNKQPIKYFAKIRVINADLSKFKELFDFFRNSYVEAAYCIYDLIMSNAFYPVATAVEMMPDLQQRLAGKKSTTEDCLVMPTLDDLKETESFKELAHLSKKLFHIRKSIPKVYDITERKYLFDECTISEINFSTICGSASTDTFQDNSVPQPNPNFNSIVTDKKLSEDVGKRRRELKAAAMTCNTLTVQDTNLP